MRNGEDWRLRPRFPGATADESDEMSVPEARHTMLPVYGTMLRQICLEYASLPDPRTLTMTEIRFYYEGLRPSLKFHTKPRNAK